MDNINPPGIKEMSNNDLIQKCRTLVNKLSLSEKHWTMSVPVKATDSDILLIELIERFEQILLSHIEEPENDVINISTDIFEDEKIKQIEAGPNGTKNIMLWLKLLCFAGKQNMKGRLCKNAKQGYTVEELSVLLNSNVTELYKALDRFYKLDMIDFDDDDVINIVNFNNYQFKSKENPSEENDSIFDWVHEFNQLNSQKE